MRKKLIPPASEARCRAIVYLGSYGFAGRCPYRRTEASDLCGRHGKREASGITVKRSLH